MSLPVLYDDEEVKKATGCLDWHQHCGARCCKEFRVAWPTSQRAYVGMTVKLPVADMSADLKWYLELHGCSVNQSVVTFQLKEFRRSPGFLHVVRRCDYLTDDLRCKGHPFDKPKICSGLDLQAVKDGTFTTPGCLYKLKAELEVRDDEEKN